MSSTWAQIAAHEEPVVTEPNNPLPLGWVQLCRDKKTNKTIIYQNENDPYLIKKEEDLNILMSNAIRAMRKRWEMHHYLSGTYYDYDIHEDIDDYESSDSEYSDSESEDEQNGHLGGGGYYNEDN